MGRRRLTLDARITSTAVGFSTRRLFVSLSPFGAASFVFPPFGVRTAGPVMPVSFAVVSFTAYVFLNRAVVDFPSEP